jgi:hypothetical protein
MADPNPPPAKDHAKRAEKTEAAATTAATGLGCLGFVLMPWTIILFVVILITIAWVVHRMLTT